MSQSRIVCLFFGTATGPALGPNYSPMPVQKIAEACYRFTRQIAIRDTEAVFLDLSFGKEISLNSLVLKLTSLCRRFGLDTIITTANDAPTALALAKYRSDNAKKLPIDALAYYISPFEIPHFESQQKIAELLTRLNAMGVDTLKDFARLAPGTLSSQFGVLGLEASRKIQEGFSRAWPSFNVTDRICEKLDLVTLEGIRPSSNVEALLFLLRTPIDRAIARLKGRDVKASEVEMVFELESPSKQAQRIGILHIRKRHQKLRRWTIVLSKPETSTKSLVAQLREKIAMDLSRLPLPAPVVSIQFHVIKFFPERAWGKKRTFPPNLRPLPAFIPPFLPPMLTLSQDLDQTPQTQSELNWSNPSPKRPTRILKHPEKLDLLEDHLVSTSGDKRWQVIQWEGAENVSHIENEDPHSRKNYFRAFTADGEELLLYSNQKRLGQIGPAAIAPSFYLQGYFD